MIEPVLLTAARVSTFNQRQLLTNASGFYFERDGRLFLVTSRHVVVDEPTKHFPDRIEIELHIDAGNIAQSTGFSIPLYRDRKSIWRQGRDAAGGIDVALIELERKALPATTVYRAFTPAGRERAGRDRHRAADRWLSARVSRHVASSAGRAPRRDRIVVRPALSG
jgi:hypothetical protein